MLKFKKGNYISLPKKESDLPEGLWMKCDGCGQMLYKEDVVHNHYSCYKCGKYFRLSTKKRIRLIADRGTFEEWFTDLENSNPLDYPGYPEKIEFLKDRWKIDEAVTCGKCKIHGEEAAVCICDARFLMGSMGYVVGEKITRSVEKATELRLPLIIFTCSGGARMQEGMVSLMQMAKTAAALKKHSDAGLLYLTVLTDPTTGGVTASFAMLGDIILAEPGALVGFAGPRVIEQTIGQKLPEGFQRSEFLVEHGLIDGIIERDNMKGTLAKLLQMHHKVTKEEALILTKLAIPGQRFENQEMEAWERVMIARSAGRPTALDYINEIFADFEEFHGDRHYGDDGATVGGIAYLDGCPVTVIGQQKGRSTKENIKRNFGMPSPEGYRKALRLMKQAEKFHRPIINFVDTPGAFCGLEAEEHGQGEAIARNLMEMSGLKVPVLTIVIGEGGSGGALALAVANEVWMMENATYTILSPEGFASILWKDSKRAPEAAGLMKVTAKELHKLHIIDKVIAEPKPACNENLLALSKFMRKNIRKFLYENLDKSGEQLAEERYNRFRNM
ncbi:Acetyl-coenzyme A carboxylase carboxyl transferase subunit beta [uncultured Roseburia sp.]|uniref:Multifunctional fusion protein n=1 Tax=Brotonthovivens ammoniilytica TaxID=2981725 RepID=A0ABT2TH34_9FIRM|nr:acetyl-CoA carboxylase carboxyltransferase subunit alpha [Brotonthovivens ammoniilytica]MCU6761484.1 acetyl-CoA carboxylase carboxyltransferase subunit alpha [Brotonthovivens ammoniilytica]SCI29806.1 Acetyl-coenzyme A carboxylase carboxyl transferase subunit beta [uncultured Roseburia sp.]